MRGYLRLFSAFTLLILAPQMGVADDIQEKESRVDSVKVQELVEKVRETKSSLNEAEAEKRKILGALYNINKRMRKIGQEKSQLTDELFQVQGSVQNLAKIIAGLELQIEKQRRQLKTRLRTLYKLSGEGYLRILFAQTSAHELDRTLKYLKIVSDNDFLLMRNYQANIKAFQERRKQLKSQVQKLVGVENRIKQQESLLQKEHLAKSQIASELDAEKISKLANLKQLRSKSEKIKDPQGTDQSLLDLLKPSFFEHKKRIPPPVIGSVVQSFGMIRDPKEKVQLSHKGWQFKTESNAPVSAVFDGVVAFTGWINGFGQTVILDHGDHYYSIYGHTSRPVVKGGQRIKAGQTLASAGSTSRRFGDGIYFEIRHFSEPEDPALWINAKSVQISSLTTSMPE